MKIIYAITEDLIAEPDLYWKLRSSRRKSPIKCWIEPGGWILVSSKTRFPIGDWHRIQWWQTLGLHLALEEVMSRIMIFFDSVDLPKFSLLSYDIVFGFITGRKMKEIIGFWRTR
jgi:hypothetical protein